MVTPSAPSCHNIPFNYPLLRPKKLIEHLSIEEKHQLCDATDEMLKGIGNLRGVYLNFSDGTIRLEAEYIDGDSREPCREEVVIDMVARKFFENHKQYIEYLHPEFASRIWKSTYVNYDGKEKYYADDMKKISDLFYLAYERFKEYHTKDGVLDFRIENDMMSNLKGGFKSYNVCHLGTTGSLNMITGEIGEKFKKLIQSYPPSLLSKKHNERAMVFLQSGLEQKQSFEEQLSYLKKVVFLLNFKDLFKGILEQMYQTAIDEKNKLRGCRGEDVFQERQRLQTRISLLKETLSEFPVSDLIMLIPLAFRSSPEEFSKYNEYFEKFSLIPENYLESECYNAQQADTVIRNLLQKNFSGDFSLEKSDTDNDILSINQYLMGLSGLTFSQGLMGRVAMEEHRTNTYYFDTAFTIHSVKDNILMEFLLEVTNCSSHNNYDWMVEKFLAHMTRMMGTVSPHEIRDIISQICKLSQIVDELPVAEALLKKSKSSNRAPCDNRYVLRNSAGEKLYSLCKTVREKAQLPPLDCDTSSPCSIM